MNQRISSMGLVPIMFVTMGVAALAANPVPGCSKENKVRFLEPVLTKKGIEPRSAFLCPSLKGLFCKNKTYDQASENLAVSVDKEGSKKAWFRKCADLTTAPSREHAETLELNFSFHLTCTKGPAGEKKAPGETTTSLPVCSSAGACKTTLEKFPLWPGPQTVSLPGMAPKNISLNEPAVVSMAPSAAPWPTLFPQGHAKAVPVDRWPTLFPHTSVARPLTTPGPVAKQPVPPSPVTQNPVKTSIQQVVSLPSRQPTLVSIPARVAQVAQPAPSVHETIQAKATHVQVTKELPKPIAPANRLRTELDIPQVLHLLRSSLLPAQREWAARVLGGVSWQANPEVLAALLTAANQDQAGSVRAECVRSIGRMEVHIPSVIGALRILQTDNDPRVRDEATRVLGMASGLPLQPGNLPPPTPMRISPWLAN